MLNIPYRLTVTPVRAGAVVFGESTDGPPLDPVEVVRNIDAPTVLFDDAGGQRAVREGRLYTRRGVDLKVGDQVSLPEGSFGVYGGPDLDFVHPMTGYDFGWVRWHIRMGG